MIRRWWSSFFKNNKSKFLNLGSKLIMVAIVVFIATIIISIFSNNEENTEQRVEDSYNPIQTVIKGSDVSKEQYETDKNVIDTFLEYCNNGQVEEAYNLLSNDCKKNEYPTLDIFRTSYYKNIFNKPKQYNLQSWISTSKYTVYKIRYTENILATGNYDKNEIYNDYITLVKKQDKEEISISSFIISEEMNKVTEKDGIEATVVRKNTYLEDEEYEIKIKNNTGKAILLDNLESSENIKLVTEMDNTHQTYANLLLKSKLRVDFGKLATNSNKSKYIQFLKVIKDYESYNKDKENYTERMELRINL